MNKDEELVIKARKIALSMMPDEAETLEQVLIDLAKWYAAPVKINGKMTQKQVDTLKYINEFREKNGYPPTYRDIQVKFGFKSPSVAFARARMFRHLMRRNA